MIFSQGKKRFEIRREIDGERSIFVGYVNGERSVTGPKAHVTARVLIEKHVVGTPEAIVLRFPPERRWDFSAEIPSEVPFDLGE